MYDCNEKLMRYKHTFVLGLATYYEGREGRRPNRDTELDLT